MRQKLTTLMKYTVLIWAPMLPYSHIFAAPYITPGPPSISAKSYVVMDYNSGMIIAEHKPDKTWAPASLTKVLTSYIIGQEIKKGTIRPTDKVNINRDAWSVYFPGSSKMFLKINTQVTVDDLNHGIIVDSGNDACVAIADYIAGGSRSFAQLMNNWAKKLGMNHSHFMNPDGLDEPHHYVTARDMAILCRRLIHDLPQVYKIYSERSFTYNGITQYNRNTLLWDSSQNVDGVKTGHTKKAGFNLVTSAKANGMRLITVILGTSNKNARDADSRKLLTWGFRFFKTIKAYKAGICLTKARIWKGKVNYVSLGVGRDVAVTLPRGQEKQLKANYKLDRPLEAPLKKFDPVGTLQFRLDGKKISSYPLVALQHIPKGSILKQFIDYIRQLFASCF